VSCREQQEIEQQLAVITGKIKMQHFCQERLFYNVLSYKQIAEAHVNAWPFVPDALSAVGHALHACIVRGFLELLIASIVVLLSAAGVVLDGGMGWCLPQSLQASVHCPLNSALAAAT
jgi:hypothetical protein